MAKSVTRSETEIVMPAMAFCFIVQVGRLKKRFPIAGTGLKSDYPVAFFDQIIEILLGASFVVSFLHAVEVHELSSGQKLPF